MKSKGTAYVLWLVGIFGILGFHRFYLGKIGTGILWLLTFGLLGFGAVIDLFTLGSKVEQYNTNEELKTIRANALYNSQPNLKKDNIQEEKRQEEDFDADDNQFV